MSGGHHGLPADDLYARLELPVGATSDAIEVAWRALLKRHHPDVAGDAGLEATKRINVAHDWLSDPELRARYDRERHPGRGRGGVGRRDGPAADRPTPPPGPRAPWPADPATMFRRFLDRVGRLSPDELDRLSMAEPHAIAFAASLDRILPADRRAAVDQAGRRVRERLGEVAWARLPVRDAVLGVALELTIGPYLDVEVPDPTRSRIRERLLRSWEAAIDQPRYGPNTAAVERVVARAARLTTAEARVLARAGDADDLGADPWPFGDDPAEDEALRVSAALAAKDVAAAPPFEDVGRTTAVRARRVLGRVGHVVALRHGFGAPAFTRLVTPWREATGDPATGRAPTEQPRPTVRRSA